MSERTTRTQSGRSQTATRNALASASALLLLGVLTAASLDLRDPVFREFRRDVAAERAAVRQLTITLAKAVRGMVGGADQAGLAPKAAGAAAWTPGPVAVAMPVVSDDLPGPRPPLREALHNLPPPLGVA